MIGQLASKQSRLGRELAAVVAGTVPACQYTCDCHGGYVCIRAEDHPHDPDADMGEGRPRGNVTPHVAQLGDGTLLQWCGPCPPQMTDVAGNPITPEEAAEAAAAAQAANLQALIDSVGAQALAAALAPHLNP